MPERTLQVYENPSNICSRQLTEEERNAYSVNPMSVIGMQFIFQPDFTEEVAYKVVQLGVTEEKMFYLVQFAGCADSIEVSKAEMEDMLKNSALQVINSKWFINPDLTDISYCTPKQILCQNEVNIVWLNSMTLD